MSEIQCPFCSNEDPKLLEVKPNSILCIVCSKDWKLVPEKKQMTGRNAA